jgi:hypothetical protein
MLEGSDVVVEVAGAREDIQFFRFSQVVRVDEDYGGAGGGGGYGYGRR